MKLNDKFTVNPEFEDLFSFQSKEEEIEHEATMIMFRFLSELEKKNGKPMKKKDLAKALETSPSYITQLFRGDKLINLTMLARIQDVFNITFEITAKSVVSSYESEVCSSAKVIQFRSKYSNNGTQLYNTMITPDYKSIEKPIIETKNKIA